MSSQADESLACPSCERRHAADERFCTGCGMPLVHGGEADLEQPRSAAHERARKIRPEYSRGPLVRAAGGRNQAEAELIQNLLLEEGVPSMLRRSAGFDVPDFLAAGPRDVLVPESGAGAAREVLQTADLAPTVSTGSGRPHAAWLLAAIAGGGAFTALLAWALIQLA